MKKKNEVHMVRWTAMAYAVIIVGVLPLIYKDGYHLIRTQKCAFFRGITIAMIIAIVLFAIMERLASPDWGLRGTLSFRPDARTAFAAVFLIGLVASTVFSATREDAWTGNSGREMGTQVYLLCFAAMVVLAVVQFRHELLLPAFFLCNSIVIGLGILQFWGFNPLGMYDSDSQRYTYISTIGNTNMNCAYLSIVLPVSMSLVLVCKKWWQRLAIEAFLFAGFLGAYMTNADSWMLGIGAAFVVLLWIAFDDADRLRRFWEVCATFLAASVAMKLLILWGDKRQVAAVRFQQFHWLPKQTALLGWKVLIAAGVLVAALGIFAWAGRRTARQLVIARGILFAFLAVFIVLAAAVVIRVTKTYTGTDPAITWMRLDDSFGGSRGFIWRKTIESFGSLPLMKKLFGYGTDCFYYFVREFFGAEADAVFVGSNLVDAHDEFLQYLVTIGIVGAVGYFGLLISSALKAASRRRENPVLCMGPAVVAAYIAQGTVNNPTIFTTPLLFAFLGLLYGIDGRPPRESGDGASGETRLGEKDKKEKIGKGREKREEKKGKEKEKEKREGNEKIEKGKEKEKTGASKGGGAKKGKGGKARKGAAG